MNIELEKTEHGGEFIVKEEGERLGELTYRLAGDSRMTIDHTGVDPSLRGKGVGRDLVVKAVEFARENDLKIMPVCPYARKIMEESDEFADVLA
jgi:uncharacterized protein